MYVSGDTTTSGDKVLLTNVCMSIFSMVSSSSSIFPLVFSAAAKLTGEFTSLEEPTDDPDIVIVLVLLADGSSFTGSERQVEPKNLTQKLRLLIVNTIFWFVDF
jgi:hypothetical protein